MAARGIAPRVDAADARGDGVSSQHLLARLERDHLSCVDGVGILQRIVLGERGHGQPLVRTKLLKWRMWTALGSHLRKHLREASRRCCHAGGPPLVPAFVGETTFVVRAEHRLSMSACQARRIPDYGAAC
eukprot:5517843-Prymnesium_polylepis.1